MIEQDTVKLLRECDAGIKMGTESIDDVIKYVHSDDLKNHLSRCKNEHQALGKELEGMLDSYGDDGKEPNAMAKSMSWLKTNVKLGYDNSDHMIADLMTDGCNMGVKSLNKYLYKYKAANEKSKDITKRLITLEQKLSEDIKSYL